MLYIIEASKKFGYNFKLIQNSIFKLIHGGILSSQAQDNPDDDGVKILPREAKFAESLCSQLFSTKILINGITSRNNIVMIFSPLYLIFTFFYLAVEVNWVHGGGDDVGVAVSSSHNACNLIHQLHGHTCVDTHTQSEDIPTFLEAP